MVRKHSILFAGQMCHRWGRQMSATHFVENNIIDPALPHSYRFSSNVSSISTMTKTRPSQWLMQAFSVPVYVLIYWGTLPEYFMSENDHGICTKIERLYIIYNIQQCSVFPMWLLCIRQRCFWTKSSGLCFPPLCLRNGFLQEEIKLKTRYDIRAAHGGPGPCNGSYWHTQAGDGHLKVHPCGSLEKRWGFHKVSHCCSRVQ